MHTWIHSKILSDERKQWSPSSLPLPLPPSLHPSLHPSFTHQLSYLGGVLGLWNFLFFNHSLVHLHSMMKHSKEWSRTEWTHQRVITNRWNTTHNVHVQQQNNCTNGGQLAREVVNTFLTFLLLQSVHCVSPTMYVHAIHSTSGPLQLSTHMNTHCTIAQHVGACTYRRTHVHVQST